MAAILGFVDDIFDIRWLHKLPIPIIASIPVLMVYYAEKGNTNVVVPIPLRPIFGNIVNLGLPRYHSKFVRSINTITHRPPILCLHVLVIHVLY
jgi:UDP-N-acetylmuramyl pentapeptide phosphotransferase/UDP-N-acetylglucosamine-1-phosphate transferase